MSAEAVEMWMEEEFGERWRSFADAGMDDAGTGHEPAASRSRPDGLRERKEPLPLAVVEKELPSGLFGFTRRDSSHVVVNSRLYKVDKERTKRHEKTHHRHPKDELTVRYINGDMDVRNTLSFQADNPGRITGRSRGRTGVAAYAASGDSYNESYT